MTESSQINAARIIRQAYSLSHVISPQEEIEGYIVQEGLDYLNETISQWGSQGIYIPYTSTFTISLIPGQFIYTTDNVIAEIQQASINADSGNPQQAARNALNIANEKQFNLFDFSVSTGRPSSVYLSADQYFVDQNDDQLGSQLYFYPTPSDTYEVQIIAKFYLQQLSLFETLVELPPYYIKALRYELANDLINQNGTQVSQSFYDTYNRLKKELISTNPSDLSVNNNNEFNQRYRYRPWGYYVD